MRTGILAIEDTRYRAALECDGVVVEQRGRIRGLRAAFRHSDCGRPRRASSEEKGWGAKRFIQRAALHAESMP